MTLAPLARYALPPEPRTPHCGPTGLWSRRDVVRTLLPLAVGAVSLGMGWYGAAEEADWHDHARWIVLAVTGVALGGLGLLGWVIAGRVRIVAARRAVIKNLTLRQQRSGPVPLMTAELVTAPDMHRRHRPSCLLMTGKAAKPATDWDDLIGCGVCGT